MFQFVALDLEGGSLLPSQSDLDLTSGLHLPLDREQVDE